MTKKAFFILTSLFVGTSVFAQQNCEDIQKENTRLKELVGLYSNPNETAANVEFSFFAAKGDIKSQTVTVEVLLTNVSSVHTRLLINKFDILDEQNDSHTNTKARFGAEHYSSYCDILSNTPKKFTAIIENVSPETFAFVKAITFNFTREDDMFNKEMVAVSGGKIDWK